MPEQAAALARQLLTFAQSEADARRSTDTLFALASAEYLMGETDRANGGIANAERSWNKALANWPTGVELTPRRQALQALILKRLGRNREAAPIEARLDAMGFRHPVYLRELRTLRG